MSTLFFDVSALSNVLACIRMNLPACHMSAFLMSAYAAGLAQYSKWNAHAFTVRYNEPRRAPAADEILHDAQLREDRCNREAAIGFFRLAAYNLDDYETPALLATLRLLREAAGITPAEMHQPHETTDGSSPPSVPVAFSVVRL